MTASDSLSSKLGTRARSTPTLQGHKNPSRGLNGLKGPGFHGVRGVFPSLTVLNWREAAILGAKRIDDQRVCWRGPAAARRAGAAMGRRPIWRDEPRREARLCAKFG